MPFTDHDPTVWRPAHALDARRATQLPAPAGLASAAAAAEVPYRRVACPSCGFVTDDESLLDVRELTPAQREAFGFHGTAPFACTHVCLNDALNAGASLVALLEALGAPPAAIALAQVHDDTHPVRLALVARGEAPRPRARRHRMPSVPFTLHNERGA